MLFDQNQPIQLISEQDEQFLRDSTRRVASVVAGIYTLVRRLRLQIESLKCLASQQYDTIEQLRKDNAAYKREIKTALRSIETLTKKVKPQK